MALLFFSIFISSHPIWSKTVGVIEIRDIEFIIKLCVTFHPKSAKVAYNGLKHRIQISFISTMFHTMKRLGDPKALSENPSVGSSILP